MRVLPCGSLEGASCGTLTPTRSTVSSPQSLRVSTQCTATISELFSKLLVVVWQVLVPNLLVKFVSCVCLPRRSRVGVSRYIQQVRKRFSRTIRHDARLRAFSVAPDWVAHYNVSASLSSSSRPHERSGPDLESHMDWMLNQIPGEREVFPSPSNLPNKRTCEKTPTRAISRHYRLSARGSICPLGHGSLSSR